MVQESWLDTVCTTEKLKPRSAIKGTLRGVRGGENSPYSITQKRLECLCLGITRDGYDICRASLRSG